MRPAAGTCNADHDPPGQLAIEPGLRLRRAGAGPWCSRKRKGARPHRPRHLFRARAFRRERGAALAERVGRAVDYQTAHSRADLGGQAGARRPRWSLRPPAASYVAYGFVLGVLAWTMAVRLGIDAIPDLQSPHFLLLAGVVGAMIARTPARWLLGTISAALCLALLVVMYTPLAASA